MADNQPIRPLSEGEPPSADPSSLKGLTMALGIEPAKPGHDPLLGCDIGGVRIVRLIAEGGMGRVYEGKQEKPNRTVAVKVMRPGLTSPSILKRFEYEAEVLGRLQHPGIAHIYSVGVHRMGNATVPYFVMEYIADARTLTQYADDLKLPTRQRLDLFQSVCDAVAHGHQKGVIHRDLKPSNILVDASGQPKVIDFGVARATDSDMALTTMQTDVGQLIGTLQYMSPEQFNADPNDIDIRSDVYALGVILYELLAGKPPYDVKKKAIYEVMRIVKEEDPTPLSSFNRALKGDVAVIAGKCLEKDRGRRYSSASELGADVGRYLSGEAISASPPGFIDGLVRLARKHRVAAAAVAGVFATLVLAVVGIGVFAARAERERLVAIQERDRANASEEKATRHALKAETATQRALAANEKVVIERERAQAETAKANQRLYVSNVYRLNSLIDKHAITKAQSLFQDMKASLSETSLPIELRLVEARLETADRILPGDARNIAASADGKYVAVADSDLTQILDCALNTVRTIPAGIKDWPGAMALNYQGTLIATASGGRDRDSALVKVWDIHSGTATATLRGHTSYLTSIRFSPDGSRLITTSDDSTARLWDTTTWAVIDVLKGHRLRVEDACFSPDSSKVMTVSRCSLPHMWDSSDGKKLRIFSGKDSLFFTNAVWSPSGEIVATADESATPRLWEWSTGQEVAQLSGHREMRSFDQIFAIAFSPNGELLATASADNSARVWNGRTGEPVAVCIGHNMAVSGVAFSPSGDLLATWSRDGSIRLWNPKTGGALRVIACPTPIGVAFTIDGQGLIACCTDGAQRLWNCGKDAHASVFHRSGARPECVAFNDDGSRIALASSASKVEIVESESMRRVPLGRESDERVLDIAWNAHGTHIAALDANGTVYAWESPLFSAARSFPRKEHLEVGRIAISPDASFALASSDRGRVLWDLRNGKTIATLKNSVMDGSFPLRHTAMFVGDGSRCVTVDKNPGRLTVWNSQTGEILAENKELRWGAASINTNHEGTRVVVASLPGHFARVYDVGTCALVSETREHSSAPVCDAVFSPDGAKVASADIGGGVFVWDVESGETQAKLSVNSGFAETVCFSPNGRRLITASTNGSMQVWDSETGEELGVLEGHSAAVRWAKFSPTGDFLASASSDGTLRVWGITDAKIASARAAAQSSEQQCVPLVEEWFRGGRANVLLMLQDAKQTMPADKYRAIMHEVLRRGAAQHDDTR